MAYRKLNHGDVVRVIDKNSALHCMDAIVIDDRHDKFVRVQGCDYFGDVGSGPCDAIDSTKLLIVHDLCRGIVDGVVDHALRENRQRQRDEWLSSLPENDEEEFEACGSCSCCEWHNSH